MKLRMWMIAGSTVLAASCATAPKLTRTEIVTDPPGFEATIVDFGVCVTPCTVEIDRPRRVEIVRAGYFAERFEIKPGQKRVDVKMRLVAPTVDVDKGSLPDIK